MLSRRLITALMTLLVSLAPCACMAQGCCEFEPAPQLHACEQHDCPCPGGELPDDDGRDCLCEGAVVASVTSENWSLEFATTHWLVDRNPPPACCGREDRPLDVYRRHLPRLLTGREVCSLICALLL